MIIDGELHTITNTLCSTHLGHSIDLLQNARTAIEDTSNPQRSELSSRYCASSIIHSFAALESMISYLGYEIFFHEESKKYIQPKDRGFLLRRFIQSWNKTACIDKLIFLVTETNKSDFPENLNQELRELNTLRNWLVHGFSYTTTFLLQEGESNKFDVIDIEESVNWAEKFPHTKFNRPHSLSCNDAELSLRITLNSLKLLSDTHTVPIAIFTISPDRDYKILFDNDFDIDAVISGKD